MSSCEVPPLRSWSAEFELTTNPTEPLTLASAGSASAASASQLVTTKLPPIFCKLPEDTACSCAFDSRLKLCCTLLSSSMFSCGKLAFCVKIRFPFTLVSAAKSICASAALSEQSRSPATLFKLPRSTDTRPGLFSSVMPFSTLPSALRSTSPALPPIEVIVRMLLTSSS